MDTYMDIQIWGEDGEIAASQIGDMLRQLEKDWSATQGNSVIGRLNRGEDVELTAQQQELLQKAKAMAERTGGAFDPQLRSVSLAWGFLNKAYEIPDAKTIEKALWEKQWDMGAAIKGYAGQQSVSVLDTMRVDRALLNLGGNVQTYGSKADGTPWSIGIQNPRGADYVGVVSVEGTASIVTSGDYQRYFEQDGIRYHHIMDPKTGYPADSGLSSVTVICRDGMTADALSTALFVMGLEEGTAFWRESSDFEAVFILSDGQIYATEGAGLSGCEFEVIRREN